MVNREQYSNLYCINAFDVQTINTDATTNGDIIDTQGYDSILLAIQAGTITLGTLTPIVQEGDESNLSDASAVADADLNPTEALTTFAVTDDNVVKRIAYTGNKRYIRLQLVSAASANAVVGAQAILANASSAPVTVNT